MLMNDKGSIKLYTTPDGESKLEETLQNETVWLTLYNRGFLCFKCPRDRARTDRVRRASPESPVPLSP